MADRRMFTRDIFESSVMHNLGSSFPEYELEAQRVFECLILMVDDHGRGKLILQNIRMKAFVSAPNTFQKVSTELIRKWIEKLEIDGALEIYSIGGQEYYHLTGWDKYQSGKWYKKKSFLPSPPSESSRVSKNCRESVEQEKLSKRKGKEEKKRTSGIPDDSIDRKILIAFCKETVPQKCSSPAQLNKQVDSLDKLIRLDRSKIDVDGNYSAKTWEVEVYEVLRWARADITPRANGFCWSMNFQSIPRLRENGSDKYINMRAQFLSQKGGKKKIRMDDPGNYPQTGKTKL